ncbi:uncharacterized protein SETTUDRAFT_36414 [Exserohilum turcica Et28A]|uniref:Uncharacterized protein n=1 Tax=Exserohilum turcicum (strain 28A) TaxID=671987 RepID=R0KSY0_EXST2|nr:uncharacterized protein SETTUDRAFT_36414 [Exserohilum turcica Et28A]EOA90917.1 hypothetical protein SETTUDRAFT_36414 [Exserohilum turcica Et28A]
MEIKPILASPAQPCLPACQPTSQPVCPPARVRRKKNTTDFAVASQLPIASCKTGGIRRRRRPLCFLVESRLLTRPPQLGPTFLPGAGDAGLRTGTHGKTPAGAPDSTPGLAWAMTYYRLADQDGQASKQASQTDQDAPALVQTVPCARAAFLLLRARLP